MSQKTVLIVDNNEIAQRCQPKIFESFYGVNVISAFTLEEGKRKFDENQHILNLIAVDGVIPEAARGARADAENPAGVRLVKYIIAHGYKGPLIAMSTQYNGRLRQAGCNGECQSSELSNLFVSLLHLGNLTGIDS